MKVFLQALRLVPSFSYLAWVLAQGCGPSILNLSLYGRVGKRGAFCESDLLASSPKVCSHLMPGRKAYALLEIFTRQNVPTCMAGRPSLLPGTPSSPHSRFPHKGSQMGSCLRLQLCMSPTHSDPSELPSRFLPPGLCRRNTAQLPPLTPSVSQTPYPETMSVPQQPLQSCWAWHGEKVTNNPDLREVKAQFCHSPE